MHFLPFSHPHSNLFSSRHPFVCCRFDFVCIFKFQLFCYYHVPCQPTLRCSKRRTLKNVFIIHELTTKEWVKACTTSLAVWTTAVTLICLFSSHIISNLSNSDLYISERNPFSLVSLRTWYYPNVQSMLLWRRKKWKYPFIILNTVEWRTECKERPECIQNEHICIYPLSLRCPSSSSSPSPPPPQWPSTQDMQNIWKHNGMFATIPFSSRSLDPHWNSYIEIPLH